MTGPAAAARPFFFRPGSTFIFKQLSGPAILSRPFPARSFSSLVTSSSKKPLAICSQCRFQRRVRLYSTGSDSNIPKSASNDQSKPTETVIELPGPQPSSSDQQPVSPESEGPSSNQQPQHTEPQHSSSAQESTSTEPEAASSAEQPQPDQPELPSETDSRRTALSHQFSHFMDNLQSRVLVASQKLNDLTGYSAIEAFKQHNAQLETDLATAQQTLRHARAHYKAVNAQRASTQREVTTLLARKDTWSPLDLERFTSLYRQDHELETAVQEASGALTDAEADEARLSQALNNGILRRYHEEQIWSDRIRRQSTWGTWGLMGVNVLLFLVLQFVAEPWKRNRLMKGIAAEEKAALEAVRRELEEVKDVLVRRDEAETLAGEEARALALAAAEAEAEAARLKEEEDAAVVEDAGIEAVPIASLVAEPEPETVEDVFVAPAVSWKEFFADRTLWRPALEDLWRKHEDVWPKLKDLYSERRIDLRMRDASLLALEGAVAGAAVVGSIAVLLMRRS